jgi:hypothetical protein
VDILSVRSKASRIKSLLKSKIRASEKIAAAKIKVHLSNAKKKLNAAERTVLTHVKKNPKRALIIAAAIGAGVASATIKALRKVTK